uniref:Uncharacterized protein n=1 Tax=Populus trichocarpa TaxID=3694 RepID=A0A3N7F2J0_POPTR
MIRRAAICRNPGDPLVIEEIEVEPPKAWEIRIRILHLLPGPNHEIFTDDPWAPLLLLHLLPEPNHWQLVGAKVNLLLQNWALDVLIRDVIQG